MAAVKDRRQLVLGDDLVEAIGHAIVGEEALNGRMELEPFYDPRRDEIARFAHAHLALVRIDRGESHHDVRVGGGGLRNLVVRDPPGADFEFAVDREHHQANLALAIIGDRLGDGRALARLEVFACGVFIRLPESVRRLPAGNLGVGVDVDRHEVADVHCLCSLIRSRRSAPDGVVARRSRRLVFATSILIASSATEALAFYRLAAYCSLFCLHIIVDGCGVVVIYD